MVAPFPEAEFEAIIYMLLGAFMALSAAFGFYVWKLINLLEQQDEEQDRDLRTDNIGLSRRAEEAVNAVLEESMLQSELPDALDVSKATVSNAVKELFERNLVMKKKKANTYLIEPNLDELEKQQR